MIETYLKEEVVNGIKIYKTYTKIENLKPDPQNPRDITDEKKVDLKDFLSKYGDFKPLLVDIRPDHEGQLIGGNKRLEVKLEMGVTEAWIEPRDPMTDAQAFEMGTIDNMEFGHYLEDKLLVKLKEYAEELDLSKLGVHLGEIPTFEQMMRKFNKDVEEDEPPAVSDEPPVSQLGEVYQVGRHRVMCGDATKIEDVEKLMNGQKADMVFTDPPYGISIVSKDGAVGGGTEGKYRPILNDGNTQVAIDSYNLLASLQIEKMIFWGGNYYANSLPNSSCWLVWDKQGGKQVTFADCELAWTNFDSPVRMFTHIWDGFRRDSEKGEERVHPTQKPAALLAEIMRSYGHENDIVLDVFGGSGSTLIACEQLNRACYMMELDPKYCDVIRKRYAKFIDKENEWEAQTPVVGYNQEVVPEQPSIETPAV